MTEYSDTLAYLKLAFKRRRLIYTSDIMEALGIPYDHVKRVTDQLEKEGRIRYGDGVWNKKKKPTRRDIK